MTRDLFDPDAPSRAVGGRKFPYASLGHWVLLMPGLSHLEVRLYGVLRMCADNDTELCWPGQPYLAELMGLAKVDAVGPASRILEHIGAVDIETVSTVKGRQNIYTVHEAPPDDYDGPISQEQYKVATGKKEPRAGYVGPPPGWTFPDLPRARKK